MKYIFVTDVWEIESIEKVNFLQLLIWNNCVTLQPRNATRSCEHFSEARGRPVSTGRRKISTEEHEIEWGSNIGRGRTKRSR
jgi:hypothetical protein